MATFYIKNAAAGTSSHGSLNINGTQPSTATTSTGWTVGTTAATNYSEMVFNTKNAAGTFGSTALPNTSGQTGSNDCWRSEVPLTMTVASGTWTIAVSVISVTAGASGTGVFEVRVWKSTDATGNTAATEITSGAVASSTASNLTTGAAQNLTATFNPGSVSLSSQYLFIQLAWKVTGASASSTADVVIRTDATNSTVSMPAITFTGTNDTPATPDTVATWVKPVAIAQQKPNLYYMRGINSLSAVVYWVSFGIDGTASQFTGGNTPITNIVVVKQF